MHSSLSNNPSVRPQQTLHSTRSSRTSHPRTAHEPMTLQSPPKSSPRPASPLEHPYMLNDLALNCQWLSAKLTPDGWDPDLPAVRIARQPSGIIEYVVPTINAMVHLTERNNSAVWLEPNRDGATAGMKADGEGNWLLLSKCDVQRGLTGKSGRQNKDPTGSRGVFQSLRKCVWCRWTRTRSASTTSVSSTKSVLQRFQNGLKRLWPVRASCSRRHARFQRHTPGMEPLL